MTYLIGKKSTICSGELPILDGMQEALANKNRKKCSKKKRIKWKIMTSGNEQLKHHTNDSTGMLSSSSSGPEAFTSKKNEFYYSLAGSQLKRLY